MMFETAVLLGSAERSLALATTKGRTIKNVVEVDPPPAHARRQYELLVKKCGQNWIERRPPVGRYNCAGHVWASRRTSILEVSEWLAIIADDGYRFLRAHERVAPDDLAVYVDLDQDKEILHVGRVYLLEPGITPQSPPIPRVVSKWNSTSGECLHLATDVPYRLHFNWDVQYLTDRP